jgi:hypothetical protein
MKIIKIIHLITPLRFMLAAATVLLPQSLRADQQVSAPFTMRMNINAIIDESDCNNSPGPQISLGGDIQLGGLKARVIFSNNSKGTHTAVVVAQYDVSLLVEGGSITIPKQPVRGGVGGNPYIYLQFHDGNGNILSDEFYLGRCVQGLNVTAELLNEALARATVHAEDCSNRKGPNISLSGDIVLSGLHARFIFRNNVKGTHTAEDTRDISIILDGTSITLPKQPVNGGVGGNPLISIQFLNDSGEPIGDPVLLGRCVQL